jgi:calcineurin-like phosphoesterase family protein
LNEHSQTTKQVWFSSDHHFGHKNILSYCARPFDSVEKMNAGLVERWNDVVDPADDVYYLGDFALDFKYVEAYLPKLHGTIYWIPGNHDESHPMHPGHRRYQDRLAEHGVVWCGPEHELFLDGMDLLLCHFPYGMEDHTPKARFLEWRPVDQGTTLLCGHVHSNWKTSENMINVGVDQWDYKPVSLTQIAELVESSSSEFSHAFL